MEYSTVQLTDLPDEILMIIFKKLNKSLLLYSLLGLNKRLNKILCDSYFTYDLPLLKSYSNGKTCPLPDSILDRFCSQILPEIRHKINWLHLEPSSMEHILLATNYPNLYGLYLYGIQKDTAEHLFLNETPLTHIFKNQISSLIINGVGVNRYGIIDVVKLVFTYICTVFSKLRYLQFCSSSISRQHLLFDRSPPTVFSSTLIELHVTVYNLHDCLYLLDERFNQLRIFKVDILLMLSTHPRISNEEKLLNLRCFSLYCGSSTDVYDELVIPLLHRMSNLEQLELYLLSCENQIFIDGNNLKANVSDHMPRLNKFMFNIRSIIPLHNQIDLPSNEDVQHIFRDFKDNKVISCVNYFLKAKESHCHIYTYPYEMTDYNNITNNFPDGLFKCVREISLFDERPFEHDFFLRIAQSFPLMEKLTLINEEPQNNKLCSESKSVNQCLSIIKYPHLIELHLSQVHDDYIEQFLDDNKMCLPNNVHLYVEYQPLERVTQNFTRNTIRKNCSKLRSLYLYLPTKCQIPQHVRDYFPHTKIRV